MLNHLTTAQINRRRSRSPAHEPSCREWSRMSSPPWSGPSRPRAPPAADGCIDGSQSPGPDPVLPAAPPPGALPEHSGHPGKAPDLHDAPLGGGPIRSRPAHWPRMTRRQLRATPRQATTPGPTSLRALTRVPSCATRTRPSLPTTPDGPRGSAFLLTTGSVFLLGPTYLQYNGARWYNAET